MRRQGRGARLAALLVVMAMGGQTRAEPAAATFRAAHLKPELTSPEGGIWDLSDKAEAHVRASADLDTDPALNAYVRGVACKIANDYCDDLRIYVLDRPIFNAQTAPNGYVEVYSGLLLRVMDEDSLAFVLGHEISHFARNHTMARWQATKNTANGILLLTAGITVVAGAASISAARSGAPNAGSTINSISAAAQSVSDLAYLYGMSSLFAFDRDQETEADRLGYDRAKAAGYRPAAGLDAWNELAGEAKASDFQRTRDSETRASIFNTHPVTAERISALKALGAGDGPPAMATEAQRRYRAVIRPHLAEWLKDDLRRRDYGQTLFLIERLKGEGEDLGLLEFYRAEVYRHRRADGDAGSALAAYRAAAVHEDAPPAVWREIGDADLKAGDKAAAKDAYKTYLDKAPSAQDRWLIEASLKAL
jgi:predicted Zn-dependent protease